MEPKLIEKKLCNCLVPEAKADAAILEGMNKHIGGYQSSVENALNRARAKYGGLWVGGEAQLTTQSLTFRTNMGNKLAHEEDYFVDVNLADITGVDNEFGFLSGIVQVRTKYGSFKLRCFGARGFADAIMRARAAVVR